MTLWFLNKLTVLIELLGFFDNLIRHMPHRDNKSAFCIITILYLFNRWILKNEWFNFYSREKWSLKLNTSLPSPHCLHSTKRKNECHGWGRARPKAVAFPRPFKPTWRIIDWEQSYLIWSLTGAPGNSL